ncbi:MAG: hypothetical protein WB561_06310 [Terracidiphilus sp.]
MRGEKPASLGLLPESELENFASVNRKLSNSRCRSRLWLEGVDLGVARNKLVKSLEPVADVGSSVDD